MKYENKNNGQSILDNLLSLHARCGDIGEVRRIAGPAIESHGGHFLVRGNPTRTYEAGMDQRLVIVEFESVAKAVAAYESPEYQTALAVLKNSAERDVRIIEAGA